MPKNIHAYVGGVYLPTKGVQAYSGGAWKNAKGVQRYTAGAWTSALQTTTTVTNSGTAAAPVLTVAFGIPSLIQRYEWWYQVGTTWTLSTLTGLTITPDQPTANAWAVEAFQYDGFAMDSNIVAVNPAPTATVSMSVPQFCMCTITPNTTNNIIVNPTLTATVTVATDVKLVKIQVKHSSASVYTDVSSGWTTKTTTFSTTATQFSVEGLWSIRAELTRTDDSVVYSNIAQMTCVKRTIAVTSSNYSPIVGTSVTLAAAMSSAAPAGFGNTPIGWEYDDTGDAAGWVAWHTTNPYSWAVGNYSPVKFRWTEQFPDGSKIISNTMTVTATQPPETVIKGTGGTNDTLQALLDRGYNEGKPIELSGTWTINSRVYIPPGVSVVATNATFNSYTASQMFTNAGPGNAKNTTTGAAGWQKGGSWIWDGGKFDARNSSSTAFTLVHCPKATIKNCTIWNTMAHGIEINSSGGAPNAKGVTGMSDSEFNIQILNNTFNGVDAARRSSDFDEAIHIDYAWTSTSEAASTAGSGNDGTVCNNVLISGNLIQRTRTYSYSVAIGQHHSISDTSGGRVLPDAPHKNIKVISNTILDCHPVSEANERYAIHFHSGVSQVYIVSNNIVRCALPIGFEPRTVPSGWAAPAGYWIHSNTINACYAGAIGKQISGQAKGAGGSQWNSVSVNNNLFTGATTSAQTTYMISWPDTTSFSIVNNRFWGLTGSSPLVAEGGNRIHGTPSAPASGSSGMTLSGNTWSARADGVGNVSANS